jgi:hypothetical protein
MILVSFDIDGTLETGDPPGPVSLDLVRRVRHLGYIIGSASDRTRTDQQSMWDQQGIDVHFVSHKHHLADIRSRFECERFLHIGDTDVDRYYATQAAFEFWPVLELPTDGTPGWIL